MTLRVLSRPGRITQAGHIMTIVRNVAGTGAADEVGRIRLLQDKKTGQEVRCKGLGLKLGLQGGRLRCGHGGCRVGLQADSCCGSVYYCGFVINALTGVVCGLRPWGR